MKEKIKQLITHDLFKYLVAGVITTFYYLLMRRFLVEVTQNPTLATTIANLSAILVAFVMNDSWVFAQVKFGRLKRLLKFYIARLFSFGIDLFLTLVFVATFPGIIGQFVNHDLATVDSIVAFIGQFVIMTSNYLLSKYIIFKEKK